MLSGRHKFKGASKSNYGSAILVINFLSQRRTKSRLLNSAFRCRRRSNANRLDYPCTGQAGSGRVLGGEGELLSATAPLRQVTNLLAALLC